jgi:hypothetical protein
MRFSVELRRPIYRKFPVFFPVSREFWLESGSLKTPASAVESIFFLM